MVLFGKRGGTNMLLSACVATWVATASGCGTSVYGGKFEQRLDQLTYSSQFSGLREATTDLAINFRVPQLLTKEYNSISADPDVGTHKISITRFAPPGLPDFPGLQRKFEADFYVQTTGQTEISLWIGEGSTASVKGKFPYAQWTTRAKQAGFGIMHDWEDVETPTPEHGKLTWKRLDTQRKNAQATEIFQMWVYETPKQIAILGWMADKRAWEAVNLGELARVTAGSATLSTTLASEPAPAPAKKR